MNAETKILKLLISNREENFTIKKIAEKAKINYRIAYEKILLLEKENLIDVTKTGNTKVCKFTDKFNEKVFRVEYERKKDLFKNKNFLVVAKKLSELNFPFIVLLFGSYAKEIEQKGSDVDLLIVSEGKREGQIREALEMFPLEMHLTFVSFEDFIKMLKTKEFNVVLEAVKNNIILIGIEDYYRLLENAE